MDRNVRGCRPAGGWRVVPLRGAGGSKWHPGETDDREGGLSPARGGSKERSAVRAICASMVSLLRGTGGQNGWDAAGACGVRDSSLLAGGRRIFCRRRKSFRCSCLPREGRLKCPNCRCAHRPAMFPSAGGANRNMVPGRGSCAFDDSLCGGGDRNEILLIAYSLDGGSSPTRGRGSKFREQGRDGGERRRLPHEGGGSKFAALGAAQLVRCVASHTGM